ncbi:hypothetical protein [uncultured Mucilaginibacter sp.]|uniref:hypothetical protein n=1 Tax=uncultured Mucilaginibacter sp. TaxID=797541 RepID=UPI0025F05CAD|nr:hypothetical protein [uncultured Mucilaginibacter sp.]
MMIKRLNYLSALLLACVALYACKKSDDIIPEPPSTIIGKWQYVLAEGGYGVISPQSNANIYLQFNSDSTYKQLSANAVSASGVFHVQTIVSAIDGTKKPAVSFTTSNSFNRDSWCTLNTITIKDDTLMLTSNGYVPHGAPAIQVFKLSN